MMHLTVKRDLDAHYAAKARRMAWQSLWRDLRALCPRFDWRG